MSITPERIKEIRTILSITQDNLATILGVTKTTVARYELGLAKPVGDAEKKIIHLDRILNDPQQKKLLLDITKEKDKNEKMAGVAVLSGIMSMSVALPAVFFLSIPSLLVGSAIGCVLGNIINESKKIFDN